MNKNNSRYWTVILLLLVLTFSAFQNLKAQSFLNLAQQAFSKEKVALNQADSSKLPDIYIMALRNTTNIDAWLTAMQNLNPKPNLKKINSLGATHMLILGKIYQDFDSNLSDSLLATAYNWYLDLGEVEGQIYALYDLTFNSYAAGGYKLSPQIDERYQQIQELKNQTAFEPAILKAALAEINFRQIKEQFYTTIQIDSLLQVLQNLLNGPYFDAPMYIDFISSLSIQSFYAQQPEQALAIAREAYAYSKNNNYTYYTHAYNVGFLLGSMGRPKEALPYLTEALKQFGDVKTLYPAHMKVLVLNALAGIYSDVNKLDSAYYFMTKCLHASRAHAALELNQKRVFAENRYQVQEKLLQLAQINLKYTEQRAQNRWLLVLVLVMAFVAFALYSLFRQRKVLAAKSKALAEQRARLVRVLAHDLSQPLTQFTEVATLLSYLEADGRLAEMETVKTEMKNSATALQSTLQNLAIWSQFYDQHGPTSKPAPIDVCTLAQSFVFLYTPFAASKDIRFQFNCGNVGQLIVNEIVFSHLLRNLIYNAAKHANHQTTVTVEVGNTAADIIIKITNVTNANKALRVIDITEKIARKQKTQVWELEQAGLGFELIAEAVHFLNIKLYANFFAHNNNLIMALHVPKQPEQALIVNN